jgi:hypothetical protein
MLMLETDSWGCMQLFDFGIVSVLVPVVSKVLVFSAKIIYIDFMFGSKEGVFTI